jgi:hypothetical protein
VPTRRKNPMPGQEMTPLQERFCEEYIKDEVAKHAAIRAGVAEGSAGVTAARWMDPKKYPLVSKRIRDLKDKREIDAVMTGKDVLQFAGSAVAACWIDWFEPGPKGYWILKREDLKALPVHIKRLIEEVSYRKWTHPITGESEEVLHVKPVSKSAMAELLARHLLTQRHEHQVVQINWKDLVGKPPEEEDPIEARMKAILEGRDETPVRVTNTEVTAMVQAKKINPRPD